MECNSLCRTTLPQPIFRALWSPLHPSSNRDVPTRRHTVSRSRLLSARFRSSSSAYSLTIEPKELCSVSGSVGAGNPQNQLHNGSGKHPRSQKVADFEGKQQEESRRKRNSSINERILRLHGKEMLKWYSENLQNCALQLSTNEGKGLHGKLIKNMIDPDKHLWVSLINFYAKCRDLKYARQVLDKMPERDVVSWTALISGFVAAGYGRDAVCLYAEMREEGITSNGFSLATSLKAGSMCLDLGAGKQLHAEVIKLGLLSDVYVGSALVDLYAKCGDMGYADEVFRCMPEQNSVSWNALLNGYAQSGDGERVWELFCQMTKSAMKFSNFSIATILKGFANSGNLVAGRIVHSTAIKIGWELDEFVSCTLVDMYSKCGFAGDAYKVFKCVKNPDTVAWTAMITCFDQQGHKQEVAGLFRSMLESNVRPNQFTLASVVSAANDLEPCYGKSIHACIYKYGFESELVVNNALIAMYMRKRWIHDGSRIFKAMKIKDVVSWNALLSGYHDSDQGPKIFNNMLGEGFKPNMYTFISVLRSCSSLLDSSFAKQVHSHIVKANLADDRFIDTALIDVYAKCRHLVEAEVIFNRLKAKDLFTWTVMISSYARTDQGEKAVQCFSLMQREDVKPNEFTLASSLSGCSAIASLENGRQLHSLAIKTGHLGDAFVGSALVDMYGKCGCLEESEAIFKDLAFLDTVAWNTMICGYSQCGQGHKSLEAFDLMLNQGVAPDQVTFLGILSACSHLGLVEEGKQFFNLMTEVHEINPSIEHYACMVDILGRAGKFNEVESFIDQMNLAPIALIWETVLGACKIHKNIEFGERAAEKLFELQPGTDSTYILLSSIFAAKGKWSDVSNIRSLMVSRGVKKEPGCSWVETNAETHVFLSQDSSHPLIREIRHILEELDQKATSRGYVPNLDSVLQNVTDREKKENLLYHSERLALGFSLISNKANKTVRIFKNLRICDDCHDFMKFVSEIANREIVVRDIKRFHYFRNGACSCQDYW